MAAIPDNIMHSTVTAIDRAVEASADDGFRPHLGASVIGRPCERALWYSFRWCTPAKRSGRLLRLFARGQREEAVFCELLRAAGVTVHEYDARGEQFRFSAIGGHFGGSMDAYAVGFVEAPKKHHVVEMKTHNDKSFKDLCKKGVEQSNPEHYAQMQIYMALSGMDRAYYLAVNKNDDNLYGERVRYDKAFADSLLRKAERIIASSEPPARISEDPAWYQCKFCDHSDTCHGKRLPAVNCRTCLHATPTMTGDGTWTCAKFDNAPIPADFQLKGCGTHHLYIPALLANWAEQVDVDERDDAVIYSNKETGELFKNGPAPGYTSAELAIAGEMASDPNIQLLRTEFGAEVVEVVGL